MSVKMLDNAIFYCLMLYALASCLSIAGTNIAVVLASLLAIIRYIKEPVRLRLDRRLVCVMAFFGFTIFISAIFAYDHDIAFSKLWAYIYRTFPLFLVAGFLPKERIKPIVMMLGVSILLADLTAIWQGLHGNPRAKAFASHPMILAGYLIQMIPLLAVLGFEDTKLSSRLRSGLCAVVAICFPALIFNQTRGAWLAVVGIALIYFITKIKTSRKTALVITLVLVAVVAGLSQVPFVQQRAATIIDVSEQGANKERLLVWQGALKIFKDHPITGVGPGSFLEVYLGRYIVPEAQERLGHAHNNFLHILAENGIVGLSGFIIMFGYILYDLGRKGIGQRRPLALGVFLATVALLIQGFTEFNFGDSAVIRMYWFILGLAAIESREGAELRVQKYSA